MAGQAIFIGYRRDDTADVAGRVFDALEARFGRGSVFKDVDDIPVGANFGEYIRSILPRCRVALILVGPHWVDAKDASGSRRLDDSRDWVRIEVETALATPDLVVVPVLINGAQLPSPESLPTTLQPMLQLNAAVIRRDPDFHFDIDRLGNALRASFRTGSIDLSEIGGRAGMSPRSKIRRKRPMRTLIGGAVAAAVVLIGVGIGTSSWLSSKTDQRTTSAAGAGATNSNEGSDPPRPVVGEQSSHAPLATTSTEETPGPITPQSIQSSAPLSTRIQEFDDCNDTGWCPRMVIIPGGTFAMGSPQTEEERASDEGPQRSVSIRRFAVSKFEITFDLWDQCAGRSGCSTRQNPSDFGWGRGSRPVVGVSWNDAQEYVRWLSATTGQTYRLLTEAEWEYVARAGTATRFWTGDALDASQARFRTSRTATVGRSAPNPFGVYDTLGNVWEWVEDCYHDTYLGAPSDGAAWVVGECSRRVWRGGSFLDGLSDLRSAKRGSGRPDQANIGNIGFRVARDL